MTPHPELRTPNGSRQDVCAPSLTLERATLYLASRARVRTPLGAGEYLACMRHHARENYEKRLTIALQCLSIYRQAFPNEYARSSAPPFSTQREHEFYRLVHTICFPLVVDEEADLLTYLEREPRFFLPFIPMRGLQQHDWLTKDFDYDSLDLPYQLALLMMTGAEEGCGPQPPITLLGRAPVELPATAPLAAVGWSLFLHACKVAGPPLQYLPVAFNLINHETGNGWLDLPPRKFGYLGHGWSAEKVAELTVMRAQADKYDIAMRTLHNWFLADLEPRLRRAIELWNEASRMEVEAGYEGMMTDDLVEAGWLPLGHDLVAAPPGEFERVLGEPLRITVEEREGRQLT